MILSQEQIDSFEVFQYKICAFSLPFIPDYGPEGAE